MKRLKSRNLFFLLLFLVSSFAFAQVGIGTDDPKATLDVLGKPTSASVVDGIIVPRLTGNQLAAKNAVYLADQVATLVYITEAASSPAGKTIHVTASGYYFFDGTVWQRISFGNASNTVSNGLNMAGTNIKLGGDLTEATTVSGLTATNTMNFRSANPADAAITVGTNGNASGGLYFGNASHGVKRGFPITGADNNVGLYTTAGNVYLSANGTQTNQFVLTNAGNVGVNTNNPTAKLEVNGSILTTSSSNTGISEVVAGDFGYNTTNYTGVILRKYGISATDSYNTLPTAIPLAGASMFLAQNSSKVIYGTNQNVPTYFVSGQEIDMTLDGNGNVGIGTTTPTVRLEVTGAIKVGSETISTPTAGMIRFNATTNTFEGYNGTDWIAFN